MITCAPPLRRREGRSAYDHICCAVSVEVIRPDRSSTGAGIATRDLSGFEGLGLTLIDPWFSA